MINTYYCTKCKRKHRIGKSSIGQPHLKYSGKNTSKSKSVKKLPEKKREIITVTITYGKNTYLKYVYDLSDKKKLFKQLMTGIENKLYYFHPNELIDINYDKWNEPHINKNINTGYVSKSYRDLGIWEVTEDDYDFAPLKNSDYKKLVKVFDRWVEHQPFAQFVTVSVETSEKHYVDFTVFIKKEYKPKK